MNKIEKLFVIKSLDEEEEVYHVIHKHWIEFVGPTIKWFILGILIPGFLIWLYPEYYNYFFIGIAFVAVMATYDFFDWYMDVLILTNYGIIQSEWNGFFKSSSGRMEYDAIEDIHFEETGVLSTSFEFGDLYITRANGEICFQNAADPKKAELKILESKRMARGNYGNVNMDSLKGLLSDLIADHIENNPIETGVVKRGFKRK